MKLWTKIWSIVTGYNAFLRIASRSLAVLASFDLHTGSNFVHCIVTFFGQRKVSINFCKSTKFSYLHQVDLSLKQHEVEMGHRKTLLQRYHGPSGSCLKFWPGISGDNMSFLGQL